MDYYEIKLLPQALKFYTQLVRTNRSVAERIHSALQYLREDPFVGKPLKFELRGRYSFRVGDYRIIYAIVQKEVTVYIFQIGHRKEVYKKGK